MGRAPGAGLLREPAARSTHILKPDIRRLAKVRDSAVNEAIIMRTAKHCGLRTAEVFHEPLTRACVVERFDRLRRDDGGLSRVIQYELCQLAGTVSEKKYEKEGGPGLEACARLIREHSSRAALDLQALVQWVFFNICVGNNDSHAKNLSLCALPGQMGHAQLQGMAQQLGMKPRYLRTVADDLAAKVPAAIDQAVDEISPLVTHSSQTIAEHLTHEVKSITQKVQARFRQAS
jgi:serine/threonine-protein kinase HipA